MTKPVLRLSRIERAMLRLVIRIYPRGIGDRMALPLRQALLDELHELPVGNRTRTTFWVRSFRDALAVLVSETAERVIRPVRRAISGGPSGVVIIDAFLFEARSSLRFVKNSAGHVLVAGCVLGVGVGLSTAVYSFTDQAVSAGLPFDRPHSYVHIHDAKPESMNGGRLSIVDLDEWRDRQVSFDFVVAYRMSMVTFLAQGNQPVEVRIAELEPGLIEATGSTPVLGRSLVAGDTATGPSPLLISHGLWTSQFHADSSVIGSMVTVDGRRHRVRGVMPEGWGFPLNHDAWVPLAVNDQPYVEAFGRLRAGVGLQDALSEQSVARDSIGMTEYTEYYVGAGVGRFMYFTVAASVLVLLLACSDLAHLSFARGIRRRPEFAMCVALGAPRARIVLRLMIESAAIIAVGTLSGYILAELGMSWIKSATADFNPFFWIKLETDWRIFALAGGVAAMACMLSSLWPAVHLTSSRNLKTGRGGDSNRLVGNTKRIMWGLVSLQVALATALLVGHGLLTKSVLRMSGDDESLRTLGLVTSRISLPRGVYSDRDARMDFWRQLGGYLKEKGVTAALSTDLPTEEAGQHVVQYGDESLNVRVVGASTEFFELIGAMPLEGRLPSAGEGGVAINQALALRISDTLSTLGQSLNISGDLGAREIIGVVPDRWIDGNRIDSPGLYLPFEDVAPATLSVIVSDADDLNGIEEVTVGLDANLALFNTRTLEEVVLRNRFYHGFLHDFFLVFGGVALVLTALGLYGVVEFANASRRTEVGLRIALGATVARIARLSAGHAMRRVVVPALPGVLLGAALGSGLKRFLVGVSPGDAVVAASVVAVVLVTGFLSTIVPSLRLGRVDPASILRSG